MNRTSSKQVFVLGNNHSGQLGLGAETKITYPTKLNVPGTSWSQIVFGPCHTAAVSSNGELFTWGSGWGGKLGLGDENHRAVPTKVKIPGGEAVLKVACGLRITAAVTATGNLLTWYVISRYIFYSIKLLIYVFC